MKSPALGPRALEEGFGTLAGLRELVTSQHACALPGCSVVLERFLPVMWRAVSRGYVHDVHAHFVHNGLLYGFDLGFDAARLARRGRIVYRPYKSAMENAGAVAAAVLKRVAAHKMESHQARREPEALPVDCLCG